jgi:hypothetical protein
MINIVRNYIVRVSQVYIEHLNEDSYIHIHIRINQILTIRYKIYAEMTGRIKR